MSKIYIYNTLGREKQEFKPLKKGEILFYHCGPTVYWTQHIGNLRGMLAGDIVRRTLEYSGYKVKHARNYTDVGHLTSDEDEGEDKMDKASKRDNVSPEEVAKKYIKIFEQDTRELNILEPTYKPIATEYIKEMQKMVKELIDKGFAYQTELAIYFDITKAKDYTRLSGQILEENISGAGKGEVADPDKKNPHDFAIWFFKKGAHANAIQTWPFGNLGEGFPGWHMECSAMSRKLFGKTIDIHMGGIEHIPVHHTNEIAQSEAANGKSCANYWLHNEHLLVDNKKMSKSEGTGYSLAEVKEKGFDPLVLRYFFLSAHYRSKQNFTWKALEGARNGLESLYNKVRLLGSGISGQVNKEFNKKFLEAINDDFNTPNALAVVSELFKSNISNGDKLSTLLEFDEVLGLDIQPFITGSLPDDVEVLVYQRKVAKENKDWEESDKLRKQLEEKGYIVKDEKNGFTLTIGIKDFLFKNGFIENFHRDIFVNKSNKIIVSWEYLKYTPKKDIKWEEIIGKNDKGEPKFFTFKEIEEEKKNEIKREYNF